MRLDEAQHTTDAPEPETPADLFIHSGRRLCCHGDVGHGATSDLKKKKKKFCCKCNEFYSKLNTFIENDFIFSGFI